jgi:hypothetical protein
MQTVAVYRKEDDDCDADFETSAVLIIIMALGRSYESIGDPAN